MAEIRTRNDTAVSVMVIAKDLGISHQRVCQLEQSALKKLRDQGYEPWEDAMGPDVWSWLPSLTPGCRKVGALRWR